MNCIQEGLIPTIYFVKTSQRLSTASNDPLKVQYKIPQGHICKNGICIKTSFLLVKNISHQIVLGTPFLTPLYPFQIDKQGLKTRYNNQEILFEFIRGIEVKEINQVQDFISLIQQKQKQVKFLTKEIQYRKIEENLQSEHIQERIKQIQKQIEVRCFKCGQKGHIAQNCKNKVNVLSDNEEEYYYENNTSSSETDKSQIDPEKEIEKIENCLCQVNMVTADQELLLEMIDQIEDKEAKAKYIRKVLEQQNSKPKLKTNLSNAYQIKDIFQYYKQQEPATLKDLQEEVKQIKIQIEDLKLFNQNIDTRITNLENQKEVLTSETNEDLETFVHSMTIVQKQRWYTKINLKIKPNYQATLIALIDSGADLNCIQEGLIPTVYFVKTSQRLSTASNDPLKVQYKIPQGHICKNGICIKTSFLLVKNISHQIVLGTPFLTQLYPFQIDKKV